MPLYIQTNVASVRRSEQPRPHAEHARENFAKLSSGFRINSAADDAAGLGIAKSFESQVRSATRWPSATPTTASPWRRPPTAPRSRCTNILVRMRELAVQGSNGTLSSNDSQNLNTEFQALTQRDRPHRERDHVQRHRTSSTPWPR
jgi:flagellin